MTPVNIYDLDSIAKSVDTTARITVGTRPDGQEVGFIIYGPGSDAYKAADRALQIQRVAAGIAKRKTETSVPTDEDVATQIVDQTLAAQVTLLEHLVAGWYGFTKGGEDAPYTVEGLRAVLAARPAWGKRLANAVEDELNFVEG